MTPDQAGTLERAIEHALRGLPSGPTLGAFGIAREDCALAHIDYFHSIEVVAYELANALAEARGVPIHHIFADFGQHPRPCDCRSCVGDKAAKAAREKHIASYTNVKEWVATPGVDGG